jgi:DNA primase catalytic core
LTGFGEEAGFMARIPESEIERLKSEVSLVRLVEAKGIELKRHGADLLGLCPFHADREPSLVVSPKKNLWHCLGACQVGGSVIDWVMRAEGVSFRHAVELLKEGVPALAAGRERPVKHSTVRALPAPVTLDADDTALLGQVVGYYHETLKASPEALAYLKARGIDHPEAIERFKLGFANRTLGLRLPDKRRKEGAQVRERLEKLGLYRASGHEHFNGSLVIPVFDEQGQVTKVYGRKINDALRAGTPKHLYLPGPHRGVWNVEALQASKEIIVCEALIDALTFWCAGYRNVTSAYGVEGFTEDHLAAFQRHGTQRVLIAYDRDEAGERAAEKLAQRLIAESMECWRIAFPKGMDANEYALKVTPAAKSLGIAIRKALWMGTGAAPARAEATLPVAAAAVEITNCNLKSEPQIGAGSASPLAAHEPMATEPVLPASPVPPAPALEIAAEVRGQELVLAFGERRYRVRGLRKNLSYELLKVNVLAACGERFYVDTLDLYHAKQRASYITQAAIELQIGEEIIKADLGKVLIKLEQLQEEQIRKAVEPRPLDTPQMSEQEHEAALALLNSPDLLERILTDFEACGIVGERTNKLVGYLAAVSRKLDAPLAVVIQSSSAAGKSSLMDAVLAMMPEEERVKYSAMTGQSLFYMGQTNLKHKILAIVEEEGASRASYALKLLQSEGELTIASTGKNPTTGNLVTQEYRVEGPVMIFLTTTAIEIDEELLNRCLVLSVDENRAQTQAIHRLQRARRTLEGLLARQDREAILALHCNAQRLLKPLAVVNPYAQQLTFLDDRTRTRRDHEKYLTLIDTIALLHQYQRPAKTVARGGTVIEYVEATLDDIATANALAHEVLGRSLDELPPQTRRLLLLIDGHVREQCERRALTRSDCRFSRRSLREALGWGDTQLKIHLARLTELEYLAVHREGNGFAYELLYDGKGADGAPFVPGLIEVEQLKCAYDAERSGAKADRSGPGRPLVGPRSWGGRTEPSTAQPQSARDCGESSASTPKSHGSRGNGQDRPYTQPVPLAAAGR